MRSARHSARRAAQNVYPEARITSTVSLAHQPRVLESFHPSAPSFAIQLFEWARGTIRSHLRASILQSADLAGMYLAGMIAVWLHALLISDIEPSAYWRLWPVAPLAVVFNLCFGLYRGGLVNSAQELRRYTLASAALVVGLLVAMPLYSERPPYTMQLLVGAWLISLVLVPVLRVSVRSQFSGFDWWGQTAVIFGAGKSGRMVADLLLNQPSLGIRPVAMIDDAPHGEWQWRGVPIVTPVEMTPAVANKFQTQHAIVAMTGASRKRLMTLLQSRMFRFSRVTVIPDPFDFSSMWLSAYGVGAGADRARPLAVRASAYLVKRAVDIVGVLVLGALALPLIVFIAIAVKLDSRGALIFGHRRIGQGGREFRAWKFRSMVTNADEVLREHLQRNPHAMAEWKSKQKLREDPRITRVGRFLRKTSLDELPQLWNVLIGEMSLVGPRPIVRDERHHYREQIALYEGVLPGLSGLWQVSGRSNTSYEERVTLDSYYVRNWSIWLDFCILVKTIPALLFGRGAC